MRNWKYINGAEGIVVGNTKCKNAEVIKDGDAWVVLYAEGTKSKEFDSEAEAKKFAAQVGNELNTGDFFKRLAADAHKEETRDNEKLNEIGNAKEINITGRKGSGVVVRMNNIFFASFSLENGEKGIEKFNTESEAVKFIKTKVGNSDSLIGKTVWVRLSDGHKYKAEVLRDEGSRIYVKTPEGNQTWKLKREVEVLNEDGYEADRKSVV